MRVPLEWGYKEAPDGTTVAWGARAIYDRELQTKCLPPVILYDRQSLVGDKPERTKLVQWMNTCGIPGIARYCKKKANAAALAFDAISDHAEAREIYRSKGYVILGRASDGYLNLIAYKEN